MPEIKSFEIFGKYFPENVAHYCYDLWVEHGFEFKITRKRLSKLGDYRYCPENGQHTISVNNNLNKYSFLITYLHEVSHLVTYKEYSRKTSPHGKEWKQNFKKLLVPVMNNLVFPEDILVALRAYMVNPKASSYSDQRLAISLFRYNEASSGIPLSELSAGSRFTFNQRVFEKEKSVRTRVLCKEMISGKKYSISKIAMVEPSD